MKMIARLFFFVALAAVSLTTPDSVASTKTAQAEAIDRSICKMEGEVAGDIMAARQAGMPLSEMLEVIRGSKNEEAYEQLAELVKTAHREWPVMPTAMYQRQLVDFFNYETLVHCLDRLEARNAAAP